MPIIEVRALPQDPPVDVPGTLGALCEAAARTLGCQPRQVWATWHTIPDGHYVEGTTDAERQPADTHPPLVRVLTVRGRNADTLRRLLDAVVASLTASLRLEPGNVFVRLEEMEPGTVHTGGELIE